MMRRHYGVWTDEMSDVIAPLVKGRIVHDLGCGPYAAHAHRLIDLGAHRVVAIDKCPPDIDVLRSGVRYVQTYFESFGGSPAIAFIAWPVNYSSTGLVRLAVCADTVIYLGCNLGGSSCGDAALWEHLSSRPILHVVETKHNTLIVYGREGTEGNIVERPLEETSAVSGELVWNSF